MKKILFVYYSLSGNVKTIITAMHEEIESDCLRLEPVKNKHKQNFQAIMQGIWQVLTRKKPRLQAYDLSLEEYDTIIIGTPIWAGHYTPAIRSFLSTHTISNKKVGFVLCARSSDRFAPTIADLKQSLGKNKWLGDLTLLDPIKEDRNKIATAKKWIKELDKDEKETTN